MISNRIFCSLSGIGIHYKQLLALVVILALLLGIAVVVVRPPTMQSGQTDNWWTISLNLLHGEGYSLCIHSYFPLCNSNNQTTASREPAPVFLFSIVALLAGESLTAAAVTELLIYLGILIAIFILTREWSNIYAALLSAFLWAFYVPALHLISQVSGDLLAGLSVTLGIAYFLRARRTQKTMDWLISGIALGVAVLSRSAVLVLLAALASGLVLERWRVSTPWRSIQPSLAIGLIVASMMFPWLLRNELALGSPLIGSSLTGYNIFRHNYMLGSSNFLHYVGADEGRQAIQMLLTRRSELQGNINEAQMDAVYRQEGLGIIRTHPGKYIALSVFRFLPLWFNWQVPEAYGLQTSGIDYLVMLEQAVLLLLVFLGLRRNWRTTWPLWLSVAVVSMAYMGIDSQLRYLIPVMPLVLSLGAETIVYLVASTRGDTNLSPAK